MNLMPIESISTDSHLPPSANHKSGLLNVTRGNGSVLFFIIEGLASFVDRNILIFIVLLLAYIVIVGGNAAIIYVVWTDSRLSSPMFYFLSHLAFVDIAFTTSSIPKMLHGFLVDVNTISVPGCFLQTHFFIQLGTTDYTMLTVMAFDRYVAICDPLRYSSVITRPVQRLLVAAAWGFAFLCTLPATAMSWGRRYCDNVVRNSWCDLSSVRRLVCGDATLDNLVSVSFAIVAMMTTGLLILASYIRIGLTVARMGRAQRMKAVHTCSAHLSVVTISYSSASCVYISYRLGLITTEVRVIISVFFSALAPFLNPIIYSLKNKELSGSIRRTMIRVRLITVRPGPKDVSADT